MNNYLLDDAEDELLFPMEQLVWHGKPVYRLKWILGASVVVAGFFLYGLYLIIPPIMEHGFDSSDFDLFFRATLAFITLTILLVKYYSQSKERYWLFKDHLVIRKGFRVVTRTFSLDEIESATWGIFDGNASEVDYVSLMMQQKIKDPFSLFPSHTKALVIGPIKNGDQLVNHLIHLKTTSSKNSK